MGTRIVLHRAAGLLISLILTSHLINVTQASKVWGEVALPEDLEAEKASVRYPGVTDDEDFAADEASGDLPSGEEDGSTPEPSTVEKTVYFRALVNFTNSFVYTLELENIESEAFREISDAVVDTLESEYNRIAGVQTVNVVVIRKIRDDVFVELDVTSDYNSDSDQIRSVLYSVVEDGSIASYVTSVSGFEFRRLGEAFLAESPPPAKPISYPVVPSTRPCLESEFTCRDGGCIPREYFCDKRPDCVDMSDELDCEALSPPDVAPTPPQPLPDRQRPQLPVGGPCRVDQATCQNGECIPRDYLCDGERDCTDGSDEIKCGTPSPCEPNEFKCQNGRCALKLWRCDGDNDCGDNSDESYCPTKGPQDTCAPEQFMCVRDRTCIPASYQCDEEPDCADRSDEYDCSPPSVTRPPEESVKAQRGQTVTFTCTAVGVPTPIITWRLNWGHIPTSSRITVTSENGRGTLTIRDVKEGDQGAYTCEAINAKGMVFAIPDGVLSLVQSSGNCASGHFSVDGGSRCIPCFCFGITKDCQNTGRYRNQIRLRFTEEDDFKGVNVSYPSRPGTPPLSSTQLLINPEMEEFQLVDLSRRFLVLESYWTLPRQFLGNKIDSYGGSLQYKVRYVLARGLSDPEEKPDVILVGNGQRLIYRRTKPTPPTVTNQKEVKFTEENWQHSSGLPVTREDLMMTLANLESINIRTIYDNHMVSVALSDIVMDTSTVEFSIQGPAQSVEECRCPAGYSGLSCETCSAGFDRVSGGSYLGTCAGCNCNGHASDCDPVSGHCLRCQHNTEGAQCDKCRPGYFGDPRRGRPDDCKPCPCPYPETSRRFSDTCYLDQDNQATCDACRPGYTGRRCERCAPGYQGNPLQPNGKCVPSASSKCDSRGTVSPTGSRPCQCKSSVVGALCDECKTGSFHLTEGNPEGCLQCFCMGVTKQCASSSWSRDQVRGGVNGQLFSLSNGANTRTITQGVIQKSSSEVAYRSFAEVPSDIYYWVLPENFRGDKVTAYGGELRYTVRYEPRFRSLVIDGQPDVILQGNGIFLEHFSQTKPLPRIPATITVSFREGAWRRADGQPCTREHLIMALADTSVFMIRASYADNMAESSLSNIKMDIAVPHSTGQERALEVEECACPQGYRGPSCQECDVGYSRTGSGLYLGTCERCNCYGHASRCDPETGDCVQCQHNTAGPRCDRCASGYYGDPKTGGAAACQHCPCPGTSPGNRFSQTCYLASDGQPTCDSCPPGFTGRRCESTVDDCEDVFLQGILDGSLPFLCTDAELDLRDETEAVPQSRQEERSEERLQVKNVADSADVEALNTQSLSSPSVASDGLLHEWEAEPTGQSNSRVDVASPLTHTANTPRPEDGQQNLPPWLRSSWNSFGQRLSILERAHSDLKEGLQSLSSQQDALHAQLRRLIPSGRLDRARQLEKGYSVLDARMNRLESQLQVLMDSFDRCAAGYTGNPLQGQACTFANNDLNGNCQHCDRSGTERCDGGRICRCKAHVEGSACSSCRPGHFHLSPEHPEGCLKCFCMGVTQQCSSSNYYRDTVSIAFSPGNFQDMALVNRQRTNRITTGFTVEVSTDGTQLSFSNFGNLEQEAHFWQLPEAFRGDKREAYYARMRRAHKKDSPWTEEQLRKDASIWKLMDSMGKKSSRSKRAVKSSAEIQKLDDEIWALISNFSKDPPPSPSLPIPSSLSSNRLPPPSGLSSSSTRLPGSYYGPPENPSHYSRPQARPQAQRGPNVVSLHGARPGSHGKYALVYKGFSLHPEDVLFWQLPPKFRGDKVGSYGGTLRYTISYVAGQRGTPIEDADVQLIGNDITLVSHQRWQRGQGARESRQFEVAFKEEHWRRPDGMPATREHLMMVLADLDDILIRASYYTDMLSASISDIRMEVSVPNYSGLAQALEVEQCRCPPGYQGLSCQDCAPGYSRTGGGLYLGHCELCECNGHSDTCHPETGVCTTCLHNTMGELCEQCASGYFGDPTAGTPEDCQKCACPHMDPDYQFSPTCESTGNGGYQCTACQPGYTGQYCERCAPGYEGDPQRRVRCRPSNNAASLVVRVHPERVLVAQGKPVMLRCQVTGSPPHYFHWSREDRRPISGQAERRRQGEELYFPSIEPSDAGVYICTCRDQRSSNTSRAEIVVTTVARPIEVTVEEPKAQSVTVGSTVSFICTAKSQSPAYTLVWTRQGNRKLPHRAMDFNGILTIQNVQPDDAGVYVCTGSNMFAMDEGTAVLYVPEASQTQMFYTAYEMFEGHGTPSEGSQAIATAHPPVLTIQQGQRAEFRCTATGNPPPTVEWIVGHGNQISPHAIIRGGVLTITKVERSDEGEYICRASNTHGQHNARAVLYVHSASLPHVQVSPQRVQVNEGETLRLYCRAGGTPSPGLTWKKKGGPLPPQAIPSHGFHQFKSNSVDVLQRRIEELQARMERTDIGTLLIPNVRATDAGTYLCVGTNSLGSSEAPIEVSVASAEPFSTAVSIRPPVASVQEGQTLDLSCIIPGAPPVSVSWIRVGGRLRANHQVLGTQLRILNASPEDSGEYICRVDGGPTVRQASVTVTVTPRSPLEPLSHTVGIRPTVAIVRVGQPLELNCFIPGKTSASVTWIRVGGHLPRNHQVSGTRLRILNPSLEDSGEYVCRVAGELRPRQASVTVSVVPRTSEPSTHPVSIQPSTSAVREGQPLELTCVVPGTTPRSVTWIRVGGDLPRNHQVSGTRLRILNASPEDSGEYICRVDDGPTVRQASITVTIAPRSPLEPFSHSVSIRPSTATTREGQPLELDCVVPGSTPRSVTWIRVGGHLPRNHQALGTRLRILNPSPEDSGEYVCRVDDGRTVQQGSVTVSVTPRSSVEPFLHGVGIRPSTATVQEGQPLELNCVIPGSTPTSVTWIRVGGDLPRNHQVLGTRLRILNPSPEDSGEYVCRVDDGPRVQQGSVSVSVTPSSSVEPFLHGVGIRPSTATVQEGQPLELNCVIPGSAPTSVTWIRVGGDLPRNHQVLGTRLRILNPSPEDSGEYVCRVDDGPRVQQGSVTVSVTPSSSVEPFLHGVGIRPSTATVQEGQPLELNCVIPGSTPTSVTWIRVGGDLPRNHQVLGTRLRILNPSPEDSGEYICRVDDGPRVQQGSVSVSVTPSSSVEPFLHGVGIRPSTATVQEGQPLELNCVIPGSTPTSVTWIRVGGDLPRNHQVLGTRLRILNPSPEDSGEYVCRVDDGPRVQQGSVTVSVTPSSSVEPIIHGVDIQPSTATVQEGQLLELTCVVPGSTPTSVTWIRVGGDLPRDHQVLGTWLRFLDLSPEDSGEYVCRVDDGRTVQQGSVTVSVTPRSSVEPFLHGVGIRPSTATVQEGQPLELNCVIPGSAPTSVTWIRVGGDLPRNHQVLGTRLRILDPSPEDSGEYVCRVDDGPRVQQGSVTVSVTPSSSVEPFSHGVGIRPSTATVQEGQPLELTCVVPGGTATSVTWIRVGGDLPRNHQVSGTRLRIPNTSPEDSGEYICRVEGGPTVQQASVTVTVAPRTSLEPLSHPVSIRPSVASVHEGQPLELDCVVPGSTPRSVTWIRVGGHLPHNHQVLGTRLRILNPSPEDSGEYVCRVDDGRTGRQGSVSVSVTPSSSVVPTSNGVSIRPSDATVQEGQPLELDCVVPGRPPISVTWIRLGGDLPSNHQVLGTLLRILNASPADTGEYVCRVEDGSMVQQASVAVAVTPSSSTASSARLPTPTISIEPHRANVRQGDSASFRCRVHTGVRPVRLEWKLPNNRPMPDNVRVSPDGAVIIISNAQPSDQGAYRCVASNAFGMTHSVVSLFVRESPKAVVTPQGLVRVRAGDPINLECQGSGEPRPSVSWHRLDSGRRTVLTSPVPMDSNAVMQVLAARPEDSGTYICTVRNSEGLTEVAVDVRVEGGELAPSAPRASVPEPLLVVEEGQTATLRCHAYGNPTPAISWSKLRAPLPWRHRVVNDTLILPGVARQDSGQYICNATNSLGISEVTVKLDVETRPYATCLPDDLAVRVGEVIRLQCLSHGTPPLRFQWTKVNGSLSDRAEVDDGNLQINLATAADAGTYKCVVSNKVGSSEALAKVAVRSPLSVRVWPQVEVKAIGSAVEFTCSAAGGVQTTIEWIKEGGPMPVNHHINEGVLRIENLEQSDEGVYICRASGVYGQAQDTAKLTIQALPKVMINIRTSVQTVMIGNSVEFECHATGDPQPSVRWSKVGGELPAHVVVQGGMLKIERVEEADAGQYRCTATNNVGSVQSEVVLNVQSLPQIVSPPDEKEVNLGSGAVFPCVATGYPVPEIKWSKLDGELSSEAVVEGNVLTIPSVKQEDAGTYVCTASNKQGMVQAFTKLKVHERVMPHFTQTPLSYLTLPTIKNSYKAFNIKINFRPDSADGMIIYNGQKRKTGADFVSLGLVGGRPEFRFDVGSGMATLRYPTPITLGEFHTVELHRNLTLGSIVVDGHPPVNGSSQGKFQGLDLNEELFVGGYPNYTVITKKTGLKTGFIGCIRQLIIQGEEVVFKDLDQSSIGVSNCPSCKDRPCQHGGVCEDSETSIYKCSCPWGYTGSNCEHHSSQHCHPEACGADATCINRPNGLGYDCRCHLGKSGDKCTQGTLVTIPHFDGEDSFIAYPPLTNIHNDLRVEVEFKPLDQDGLMFFSGGKKMKVEDFVSLSMVDGHVEFRYELGTGMAILRSREPITIGQWHHVVAERLNKDGFLKVDQHREVRRSSPGKAQGLNIHTPMYLGGVPSMDILPKPANVSMLFEGCVGEVSINGKKVDLSYSFTESRAISQCVDTNPCDRRPCLHGGSCLASAEYEYQCLCLDGFEGERCEVVKHVCQVDAQCKNGGKCADGQCVCPGGFSGLYCEHAYAAQARSILDTLWNTEGSGGNDAPAQHAAYFHDDGYLALPKSIFPRSSPDAPETIELEIRSTTADGLILWQGVELGEEGRGQDYISLGLQSGRLVFSYQLGSGEAEIFSEEPINDGKWHKITAVRTGRLGYVQVDGGAISRGQSQGSSIMVNTKGNVFLGGAPDITALTGSRFSSGITGCVKNLELVNARPGEQPARHIDLQAHAQEGINVERCSS